MGFLVKEYRQRRMQTDKQNANTLKWVQYSAWHLPASQQQRARESSSLTEDEKLSFKKFLHAIQLSNHLRLGD